MKFAKQCGLFAYGGLAAMTYFAGSIAALPRAAQASDDAASGRLPAPSAEISGAESAMRARAAAVAAIGDYATGPLMRGLHHWDHMPVRLYFATDASSTKERVRAALLGISEWSIASRGVLWFTVVPKASEADVTIRFLETPTIRANDPHTIGQTETETEGNRLRRARMQIAVGGATENQITENVAHEYGHALGIAGHSTDSRDLMYASTTRYYVNGVLQDEPTKKVSPRDLNTIRRAYPTLFAQPNP